MAASKEDILNAISNMTVLEIVDLVKLMEDKFGVTRCCSGCGCRGCCSGRGCSGC